MFSSKTFLSYLALSTIVYAAPVPNKRAISVGIIGNEAIVEGFNEDLMSKKGQHVGIIGNEAMVERFNEDLIRKG
ncbi:hypothetical protein BOTCAL_0124g00200 [Botryotinia calthae]|uniref:Uncharacterized protein n=1 Tax=Botryotinia calthae TaxID=38488 RepID=A0A4Y8D4S8_9HELO|nr:hypothetical protein BOTCAL_0124g00200 [Botryotinia calthae]